MRRLLIVAGITAVSWTLVGCDDATPTVAPEEAKAAQEKAATEWQNHKGPVFGKKPAPPAAEKK